jgi:hypothetical protein
MKRFLVSVLVIGSVSLAAFEWSRAFFSDTEVSNNNTFQAGAIDLKVGNESYYNGVLQDETTANTSFELGDLTVEKFFNFTDIKPSDWGEDTIELVVQNNDAWACAELTITNNEDMTCTEPEIEDEDKMGGACVEGGLDGAGWGDLAFQVEFLFWNDDGDNVLEIDEQVLASGPAYNIINGWQMTLADSLTNNLGGDDGQPMKGSTSYYIGKAWCFGTLTPQPLAQTNDHSPTVDPGIFCEGTRLDNTAQTDILTGDISFTAVQSRNNPGFLCFPEPTPTLTPSQTPTPTQPPFTCVPGATTYATSISTTLQGTLKNNNPITNPARIDPTNVLASPNNQFFSIGKGGYITVTFSTPIVDGPDEDISIHEITGGRPTYPEERAEVLVSNDGNNFTSIGFASSEPGDAGDGITYLDIDGAVTNVTHVKVVDTTDFDNHILTADGFDLDAVDAVHGICIAKNN